MGTILVINAGSSSVKFALFDGEGVPGLSGAASEIGHTTARLDLAGTSVKANLPDHAAALQAILVGLRGQGVTVTDLAAAAHRVVHGGPHLSAPAFVSDSVLAQIEACIPLAPLHNPHNLAAIRALAQVAPDLPQTVSFDTGFHATNPEVATRYALPPEAEALGLRRYGFHGISYEGLVQRLPALSGEALPRRLLACHLGNGASLCAILDGRSVATTMGYSPLDGLTMGTRSGAIDGNAVLRLADAFGTTRAARMLNNEGGLLGLSGLSSDMRALSQAGTPEADFAIAHFSYWASRHAGSMIAAMGGLDAVAFTGGIGEHSAAIRGAFLCDLAWLGGEIDAAANDAHMTRLHGARSAIAAWIVPAQEEALIAEQARRLLQA
jgi:acetate kinase